MYIDFGSMNRRNFPDFVQAIVCVEVFFTLFSVQLSGTSDVSLKVPANCFVWNAPAHHDSLNSSQLIRMFLEG